MDATTINLRLGALGTGLHLGEVKDPVMHRLRRTRFVGHLNGTVFPSQCDAWSALGSLRDPAHAAE